MLWHRKVLTRRRHLPEFVQSLPDALVEGSPVVPGGDPALEANPEDGDGSCELPAASAAPAPPVEFYAYHDVPAEAVATATAIVRAAKLDVGGIEYLETPDGRRVFYDINANSNLRPSVAAEFGFDPFERVVTYLSRQLG